MRWTKVTYTMEKGPRTVPFEKKSNVNCMMKKKKVDVIYGGIVRERVTDKMKETLSMNLNRINTQGQSKISRPSVPGIDSNVIVVRVSSQTVQFMFYLQTNYLLTYYTNL